MLLPAILSSRPFSQVFGLAAVRQGGRLQLAAAGATYAAVTDVRCAQVVDVRSGALAGIVKLHQMEDERFRGALEGFTLRFLERILQMSKDVDSSVCVLATDLSTELLKYAAIFCWAELQNVAKRLSTGRVS